MGVFCYSTDTICGTFELNKRSNNLGMQKTEANLIKKS